MLNSFIENIKDILPYLSLCKIKNLVISLYEFKFRKIKLKSLPSGYFIDIGNICNLKCPLCPTGTNNKKRKKTLMSFDIYKKIFNKIKKYAFQVKLYNWGEPFLNKDLFKIIDYTKKNKVGVVLSSNFNIITDEMIDYLIKSNVDKLIISLDGADEKSYSAYRKGGDFNKVIENIKKLLKRKHELKSKKPVVVWQYLINKKNIKLVKKAKKLSKMFGIKIKFEKFQISQEIVKKSQIINKNLVNEWVPKYLRKDPKNYLFVIKAPCHFLWKRLIINSDGSISPCCAIYDSNTDFANILKNSLKQVWNNNNFLSARSMFSNKRYLFENNTICHSCASVCGLNGIKIR